MAFWTLLAVAFIALAASYVLMPKPPRQKPQEAKDLENPTAEAGRPIPVVFGTLEITGLNVLYFGDKSTRTEKIKV